MKLNGNTGWVITLMIALLGWAYSLGWQGRTTQELEKKMDTKADRRVIEVKLEAINDKLADILERVKKK